MLIRRHGGRQFEVGVRVNSELRRDAVACVSLRVVKWVSTRKTANSLASHEHLLLLVRFGAYVTAKIRERKILEVFYG